MHGSSGRLAFRTRWPRKLGERKSECDRLSVQIQEPPILYAAARRAAQLCGWKISPAPSWPQRSHARPDWSPPRVPPAGPAATRAGPESINQSAGGTPQDDHQLSNAVGRSVGAANAAQEIRNAGRCAGGRYM
eukprot:scaffold569_cov408-Prasinococcus_capsulatus_cf.AAC.47